MPDFRKMSIVEMGNYISKLLDSMPQKPTEVFVSRMQVLLAEFSNRIQ